MTYEFGPQTEVVDASVVSGFIRLDGYEASIDEEAVKAWVAGLADRRDTYKREREFDSTLRGIITVSGGNYGWENRPGGGGGSASCYPWKRVRRQPESRPGPVRERAGERTMTWVILILR